jgi:fluoroquinolone transport system permease protein
MRKYLSLLKYEMKTLFKDPMNIFILFFPFLMLGMMGFLLPAILERTVSPDSNVAMISLLIAFVTILALGGYMGGLLLGFSLLENRDEKTFWNIAVSPVTISGYTMFKIIYSYIIAVFSNLVMVGGLVLFAKDKYVVTIQSVEIGLLDGFTFGNILVFSLVSAIFVPTIALAMPMLAKNKIEGFALMKTGGLILMIPALALLTTFQDWKQYLLGVVPLFWSIKSLLNIALNTSNPADLSFWGYMVIGTIYPAFISWICFRLFIKKTDLS